MTGKRFQYNANKNTIEYDGKFVVYVNSVDGFRIANHWNTLYKENEQLRHDATILIQSNQDYRKENEQLKQSISDWSGSYDELYEDTKKLEEENEQLKHQLQQQELEYATTCNRLAEENEQLKSDLRYWRTLAESLAKGNNIGEFEMMDKEVTVDLNELDINIKKEIILKSDLNKWIEKKMDYYERIIEKTDGYNNVSAKGHLDMLIMLKEWIKVILND